MNALLWYAKIVRAFRGKHIPHLISWLCVNHLISLYLWHRPSVSKDGQAGVSGNTSSVFGLQDRVCEEKQQKGGWRPTRWMVEGPESRLSETILGVRLPLKVSEGGMNKQTNGRRQQGREGANSP